MCIYVHDQDHEEFDPGSERTLAARFKHASRTVVWCLHHMRVADG